MASVTKTFDRKDPDRTSTKLKKTTVILLFTDKMVGSRDLRVFQGYWSHSSDIRVVLRNQRDEDTKFFETAAGYVVSKQPQESWRFH